jgi:hypothetical protein
MLLPFIGNNQSGPTGSALEAPLPFDTYISSLADSVDTETSTSNVALMFRSAPLEEDPFCAAPSFIENQIPFWIKQNYTNTEETYLISFLKEYYNWLYCGFKKQEFNATPYEIEMLLDIDQAPDGFIDYYVKTYAPFIELESAALERENIRKFINNIKTKFLSSKGTKGSYSYILNTLFGITLENITYPKIGLFRLNGGKFEFYSNKLDPPRGVTYYQESSVITALPPITEQRITSPPLNLGILPDSVFWHDYSYLLQSSASAQESIYYANTILKSTHPAGTKAFFEQYLPVTPIDFGDVDDNTDDAIPPVVTKELPIIRNYLLYSPNYLLSSAGITFCSCCDANCDPQGGVSTFPQHADPRWSDSISDSTQYFGDILIGDFIELYPTESSPNPDTEDCTSCGA